MLTNDLLMSSFQWILNTGARVTLLESQSITLKTNIILYVNYTWKKSHQATPFSKRKSWRHPGGHSVLQGVCTHVHHPCCSSSLVCMHFLEFARQLPTPGPCVLCLSGASRCLHHTCLLSIFMQLWLAQWGFFSFTPLLKDATLSSAIPAIPLLHFSPLHLSP